MNDKPDSLAAKYAPRVRGNAAPPATAGTSPSPASDGAMVSKTGSSKRRAPLFLDLRKKDGTHKALNYSYLVAIDYDQKTITLEFTGYRVSMSGRMLDDVFRRLLAQVVGQIREVDELTDKATGDPKKPAVYSIKCDKV